MLLSSRPRWVGWSFVCLLLGWAMVHLLIRGPIDVSGNFNLTDFASPWASARLWLIGDNPYVSEKLWETWISSRGSFHTDHDYWLAQMFPGALLLLAPLAALPAGIATALWLILSVASIYLILDATLKLAGILKSSLAGWLIIAAALASAPMQTLLAAGQLSLPVIALIFLSILCVREHRHTLGAILLGLAITLKPQLAGPFLLWFLLFSRWRALGVACAIPVLLNLAAVARMELHGHQWFYDWSHELAMSFAPGGPGDPAATGPWTNQMIDLRVWLFTLFDQRELVAIKVVVIAALLAAIYLVVLMRMRHERSKLLPLAALCALTLLPVYHRAYDAVLLLPALSWALLVVRRPRRTIALLTLAALSIFLVPWDFLPLVMERTRALDGLAKTWIWRVVIYPHYAVATLATALCMVWAMAVNVRVRDRREQPAAAEPVGRLHDLASTRG